MVNNTRESITRVVCLGDPVLDILANVPYSFLQDIGASAGGCIAISPEDMATLLEHACTLGQLTRCDAVLTPHTPLSTYSATHIRAYRHRVAGGSAANVAKALAGLLPQTSFDVAFTGMVGRDDTAQEYEALLRDRLVEPALVVCPDATLPTATCCCLVRVRGLVHSYQGQATTVY